MGKKGEQGEREGKGSDHRICCNSMEIAAMFWILIVYGKSYLIYFTTRLYPWQDLHIKRVIL